MVFCLMYQRQVIIFLVNEYGYLSSFSLLFFWAIMFFVWNKCTVWHSFDFDSWPKEFPEEFLCRTLHHKKVYIPNDFIVIIMWYLVNTISLLFGLNFFHLYFHRMKFNDSRSKNSQPEKPVFQNDKNYFPQNTANHQSPQ